MRQIICICAVFAWCAIAATGQKTTIILYDGYTVVRTEKKVTYTDQTQSYNSNEHSCNCHVCSGGTRVQTCPSYQSCTQNNYSANYANNDVAMFFAGFIGGALTSSFFNGRNYYYWGNQWVYPYWQGNYWRLGY